MVKEFSFDEVVSLVGYLKEFPINEMWKPLDLGYCKVQRVPANEVGGKMSALNIYRHVDVTKPMDLYQRTHTGSIYLQIGRMPNTYWWEESGITYMCYR